MENNFNFTLGLDTSIAQNELKKFKEKVDSATKKPIEVDVGLGSNSKKSLDDLDKGLDKATKSSKKLKDELKNIPTKPIKDSGDAAEKAGKEFDELGQKANSAKKQMNFGGLKMDLPDFGSLKDKFSNLKLPDMGGMISNLTGSLPGAMGGIAKSAGTALSSLGGLGAAAGPIGIAATAAIALGTALYMSGAEAEKGFKKMGMTLQITGKDLENAKNASYDFFRNGIGANVDEATQKFTIMNQNFKDVFTIKDQTGLAKVFEGVSQATGIGFDEISNKMSIFQKNYKLSAEEMASFTANVFKNGGSVGTDMLDTLSEYAPVLKEAGLSANEFSSLMNEMGKVGVRNSDVIADAVKEMNIKLKDGSGVTSLQNAFKGSGGSISEIVKNITNDAKKVSDGLMSVDEFGQTMQKTLDAQLKAGKITEAQAKVIQTSFVGTKAEDLGFKQTQTLLNNLNKATPEFEKAGKNAADAYSKGIKPSGLTTLKNEFLIGWTKVSVGFYKIVDGMINGLIEFVKQIIDYLKPAFDLISSAWDYIVKGFETGWNILKTIGKGLSIVLFPVIAVLKGIWEAGEFLWKSLAGGAKFVIDAFSGVFDWLNENVIKPISDVFTTIQEFLYGGGGGESTLISQFQPVIDIFTSLSEKIKETWEIFKIFIGIIIDSIKESDAFKAVMDALKWVFDSLKGTISSVFNWFKDLFTSIKDNGIKVFNNFVQVIKDILDPIKDLGTSIGNVTNDVINAVLEFTGLDKVIKNVKKTIDNLWNAAASVYKKKKQADEVDDASERKRINDKARADKEAADKKKAEEDKKSTTPDDKTPTSPTTSTPEKKQELSLEEKLKKVIKDINDLEIAGKTNSKEYFSLKQKELDLAVKITEEKNKQIKLDKEYNNILQVTADKELINKPLNELTEEELPAYKEALERLIKSTTISVDDYLKYQGLLIQSMNTSAQKMQEAMKNFLTSQWTKNTNDEEKVIPFDDPVVTAENAPSGYKPEKIDTEPPKVDPWETALKKISNVVESFTTDIAEQFSGIFNNEEANKALDDETKEIQKQLKERTLSYSDYVDQIRDLEQRRLSKAEEINNAFRESVIGSFGEMSKLMAAQSNDLLSKMIEAEDGTDDLGKAIGLMSVSAIGSFAQLIAAGKSLNEALLYSMVDTVEKSLLVLGPQLLLKYSADLGPAGLILGGIALAGIVASLEYGKSKIGAQDGVIGIQSGYSKQAGSTDTIPLLVAPNESIINANASMKNKSLLEHINRNGDAMLWFRSQQEKNESDFSRIQMVKSNDSEFLKKIRNENNTTSKQINNINVTNNIMDDKRLVDAVKEVASKISDTKVMINDLREVEINDKRTIYKKKLVYR